MSIEAAARTVMERCDLLANYSEEANRLTRRFATTAMRQVNETVAQWMRAAGMSVWQDNIGNLIGCYEADRADAKTLLLGSHLDSVRDAGKYDGPLGVLSALTCVERMHARNARLPFALEVCAFADEEGLRYHSAYLGSKVVSGTFDPAILTRTDGEGIVMADAIRAFGGNPDALLASKRRTDDLLGYCEIHIEQGPVLESLLLPVGVVTAITGHSRLSVSFTGQAGHAGTVPMHLRHDALCAAAEFVLAVEQLMRMHLGLVATVGQIAVEPGASNVIPGKAMLSVDVRHQDDSIRERALQQLQEQASQIGVARMVEVAWEIIGEHHNVLCKPHLIRLFSQAIAEQGHVVHEMPSGAGHDAVPMSDLTDVAMLFVRCKGGISHHPAESVTLGDVTVAIRVMEQFLLLLAYEQV